MFKLEKNAGMEGPIIVGLMFFIINQFPFRRILTESVLELEMFRLNGGKA